MVESLMEVSRLAQGFLGPWGLPVHVLVMPVSIAMLYLSARTRPGVIAGPIEWPLRLVGCVAAFGVAAFAAEALGAIGSMEPLTWLARLR
jgi:hypothetical protein